MLNVLSLAAFVQTPGAQDPVSQILTLEQVVGHSQESVQRSIFGSICANTWSASPHIGAGRSLCSVRAKLWSPLSSFVQHPRTDALQVSWRAQKEQEAKISPSLGTKQCKAIDGTALCGEAAVHDSQAAFHDSQVLIEFRDVYKSFGEKNILKGASFQIRYGEAVGIIGPSGTGKSTILRIMAGLLIPDEGEVFINGKKRKGLISDEELPGLHIGLVFQSAALFDSLTVRENVGFMLYEHSNLSKEKISELVTESLAAVGLKGVEDRVPAELSGGMKKRVALARAIISDNLEKSHGQDVVMYDEPTAGLDPIASTVVEDLIRSVHIKGHDARGKPGKITSYVVVTHQHSTIRRAVDRILFLYDGKIVWEGTTSEFDTTSNPIVRQFAEGSLHGPIKY